MFRGVKRGWWGVGGGEEGGGVSGVQLGVSISRDGQWCLAQGSCVIGCTGLVRQGH